MEEKRPEELDQISKEIEDIAANSTTPSAESSSRGEDAPKPFNKSIAEMEEEQRQPTITIKELKALKRARYDKIVDKFQFAYIIQNKKTGLVVEIRAASSYHACKIIGWRPRHVRVLEVIDTKKTEKAEVAEVAEVTTDIKEVLATDNTTNTTNTVIGEPESK